MNKKILSLVLALVMVLGTFAVVSAAEDEVKVPEYTSQQAKIQWLIDNKIVEGNKINEKETDLDLEGTLTREQATKLIVYTVGKEKLADVLKGVMRPFPDVDTDKWSNGYISVARTEKNEKSNQPIVIGFEDGTFKPEKELSYAELATMLVRIVKDDLTNKMVENAVWATSWMRWADELGILDGVKVENSDAPVSRRDAFEMIFNTMYIKGKYTKGSVNFGAELGIVSKIGFGKLELNQEKTYKLTENTLLTRGTNWGSLINNNLTTDTIGSLVRIIADKDGNVTHIIELGNNGIAYNDYKQWAGTAKDVKSTKTAELKTDMITVDGVEYEFDAKTKFFVADVNNNALKEVKNVKELFTLVRLYGSDNTVNKVYLGYDKVGTKFPYNLAKAVVFGEVELYNGERSLARVTRWLNSGYVFSTENTKGEETHRNIKDYPIFPDVNYVNVNDVIDLALNKYSEGVRDIVIKGDDYDNFPVVRVDEINRHEITLVDKEGAKRTYNAKNADIFTERQFREGALVQVAFNANRSLITTISVRDDLNELKGYLIDGVLNGTHTAKYVSAREDSDRTIRVLMETRAGREIYQTFYLSDADEKVLDALKLNKGDEFAFDVREWKGDLPVMTNIKALETEDLIDKELAAKRATTAAEEAVKAAEANPTAENIKKAAELVAKALEEARKLPKDNALRRELGTTINNELIPAVKKATKSAIANKAVFKNLQYRHVQHFNELVDAANNKELQQIETIFDVAEIKDKQREVIDVTSELGIDEDKRNDIYTELKKPANSAMKTEYLKALGELKTLLDEKLAKDEVKDHDDVKTADTGFIDWYNTRADEANTNFGTNLAKIAK